MWLLLQSTLGINRDRFSPLLEKCLLNSLAIILSLIALCLEIYYLSRVKHCLDFAVSF